MLIVKEELEIGIWIILYLGMIFLMTGFALAYWQKHFTVSEAFRQKEFRSDLAISLFFALTPLGWLLLFFFTGFFEHGWMIRRNK